MHESARRQKEQIKSKFHRRMDKYGGLQEVLYMKISRRSVLRASGAAAALLALSGCSAAGDAALGSGVSGWVKKLVGGGDAASAASSEAASAAGEAAASSVEAAASEAASSLPAYDANVLTGEAGSGTGRIVGVMVNNISNSAKQNARPQRGIGSADILVESKVEGGITRLCALFSDVNQIPEIGPLRSGRDQFLQLLMPWQALYYHDGESIFCTQFVNVYNYSGLNIGGKNYFNTPVHPHVAHRNNRGRDVAYEHTEFTSGKEIQQAADNAGISLSNLYDSTFFHFADYRTDEVNTLKGAPSAKKIHITHSASYMTELTYSSLSKLYALSMYDPSKSAYGNTVDELTGKQLTFENVVVCFADIAAYAGDSHDVQEVQYVHGGQAYLFTRGGVQTGRWEKNHPTQPLKLYTDSGEEMTLNRGKTYFALVDDDEWSNFRYQ